MHVIFKDDSINFIAPDPGVFSNISTMGFISSSGFYKNTVVSSQISFMSSVKSKDYWKKTAI